MTASVLNQLGLGCGLAGVVLIFVWGPPQPTLEEGVGFGLEDGTPLETGITVAEHNRQVRSLRRRHTVISRLGLVLVGMGFALQFAATLA